MEATISNSHNENLRRGLASLGLPPDTLLTDPELIAPLLQDQRKLYRGTALAVAQPASTEQVARLLSWCHAEGVAVVPQGGNTGYCGGATPDESGTQLLLTLRRMRRIRAIDAGNFSMIAEAGCVLAEVQNAAQQAERFFPLSLGSEGSCQLGGNLATNAGGTNVLRFGMARDLTLGLEVVLPDGQVLSGLRSLRKDNTGYDLKSLFIGSEGTLGVITAASLKLWPRPRSHGTAFVTLASLEDALQLLDWLRSTSAEALTSFEVLPRAVLQLLRTQLPELRQPLPSDSTWQALIELSSPDPAPMDALLQQRLESAAARGLIGTAALASSERQRQDFWRLREQVPEAQRRAGPSLKHDISVPVATLPDFVAKAARLVHTLVPEGVLIAYGHAGDGNLHFNVSRVDGHDSAAFLARANEVAEAVYTLVLEHGGSISAEHGIGRYKRECFARFGGAARLAALRTVKRALDPRGIMNPGKLL